MDSDELVKLYRSGYEAFNRGDFDAVARLMDPDVVVERPGNLGELRGREAIRAFMEPDVFEDLRQEILSVEAFGHVLLIHHIASARGATSGIAVRQEGWQVWWTRDGIGIRSAIFTSREDALAAIQTRSDGGE